jgi:hypothetical protein
VPSRSHASASHDFSPIPRVVPYSGHQPSAPILAHAAPRTSGRVTSGHPTPPCCWGHHLRTRGAHFCVVADRFRAAPLPPPAGRCTAMPRPSNMPTSPVQSAMFHALLPCVRMRVRWHRPLLRPTPRAATSEPRELHMRTGALVASSHCRVITSARESRLAPLGHQRPDNVRTHASAPRHLCRAHCCRVASYARHLATSSFWTGATDKPRSFASPSR